MTTKKKILFWGLGFGGLCILAFIGYFFYSLFTQKEPIFFPLDNPEATYEVVKSSLRGNNPPTTSLSSSDPYYYIRYTGDRIFSIHARNNSFTILVGKSPIALDFFVGKSVVIQGKFVSASLQCIQKRCVAIHGPWVVLDIQDITLKE